MSSIMHNAGIQYYLLAYQDPRTPHSYVATLHLPGKSLPDENNNYIHCVV